MEAALPLELATQRPPPITNQKMMTLASLCAFGPGLVAVAAADVSLYWSLHSLGVVGWCTDGPVITKRTIGFVDRWLERCPVLYGDPLEFTKQEMKMFEVINPATAAPARVKPLEVVVSTRRGPREGTNVITFAFGISVAKRLGWSAGDQVSVAWGTEKDIGKVKISKWQSGPEWEIKKGNKHGTVLKVYTGALPDTFSGETARDSVRYETLPGNVQDGGSFVVIDLPKGFHAKRAA